MDGGSSPLLPAPRIRRSPSILAVGCSLLAIAANWAWADDSPSLRPLARRYADPSQLFEPVESPFAVARVVVPKQAFQIPPESPPPIKLSVDEPPAFVASVAAPRRPATAPVSAASSSAARFSGTKSSVTQASATELSAAPRPAAPGPAAPGHVVAAAQVPPSSATVTKPPAARPPVRFADAEPPAFVIMGAGAPRQVVVPIPAETPARISVQAPPVMLPAEIEAPSLTIPSPPAQVASAIPDTPAFGPTSEPLAITIGALAMADQPPPAPGAESSAAAQSGDAGSFGKVEKLGDAPPESTLEFLRQQAILLKPGQCQFDWGLSYTDYDVHAAVPIVNGSGTVTGVANERERLELMSIPFAVRYGICDGLQAYANVPLGWSNTESTSDNGDSKTNNFVGLGDISAGFNYQIMKGCGAYKPDVIASVGFIAPTGHATFATSLLAPNSALGQGFWDITCSVLAVHTIDPVVFYYGGGYVHRFDASFGNNLEVDPGQEFDYVFGVGFAVNPWVTISGTFIGNYLTRFGVNDVSIPGSDLDLMRFRVSVTIVKDKHICEPFGEIGMTPDSPSRVGVTFTY
jgi:hypothetical protein